MVRGIVKETGALALWAALAGVASCAEAPVARVADPAHVAPARDPLLGDPYDVAAVAAEVASFRGLPLRGAVAFTVQDDGATRRHLVAFDERPPAIGADALWLGFGIAPPPPALAPKLPGLFAAGLTGVEREKIADVWARRPGETNDGERAWALVHAIAHVLQEQNAVVPGETPDEDAALARRALVEGDAELTAAAFIASRRPAGDHWLPRLLADIDRHGDAIDAFREVPPFARRQWLFPYRDGFRLVAAVYRAGGFALVNRMFEHPPASTEQLLHPEKYVAGEAPMHVETPRAPEGFSSIATGTFGELRARAWLARCPATRPLSAGTIAWGGDSFVVSKDGLGRVAVVWSTVWDDANSAQLFEAALRDHPECTAASGAAPPEPSARDVLVVRDAQRVVVVLGLGDKQASAAAHDALGRPVVRPPPAPPLGDVHLPAVEDPASFVGHGELAGTTYVDHALGLTMSTAGFQPYSAAPDGEVTLEEAFGVSTMQLTVSALLTSWSPALEQRIARDTVGGFEEGALSIDYLGETRIVTDAGEGRGMRWFGREGTNEILVFVPVCNGKLTLLAHGRGEGYGLWKEVKRALHGMRFDPASPACRFVTTDAPSPPSPARP